jgi:Fur family peroxide stress response transcriptional regulator
VLTRHDHPTADQVYDAVKTCIPGVSRTTVYRVLETLVGFGVITRVCHPGGVTRFDPKIHQHHHLVCLKCGAVTDVEDERLNAIALPAIRTRGFDVHEYHIHFRGVCAACKKRKARSRDRATASGNRATVGGRSLGRRKSTLKKRR